jgi:hypothetical protein
MKTLDRDIRDRVTDKLDVQQTLLRAHARRTMADAA